MFLFTNFCGQKRFSRDPTIFFYENGLGGKSGKTLFCEILNSLRVFGVVVLSGVRMAFKRSGGMCGDVPSSYRKISKKFKDFLRVYCYHSRLFLCSMWEGGSLF